MPDSVDSTSFDFYEGIRIFIPGAVALGTAELVLRTLGGRDAGLGLHLVPGTLAAIAVGLIFYYIDVPTRAASYGVLRPTDVMISWRLGKAPSWNTANFYFVLLDDKLPPAIRARALYMGSMFRIGLELIYILTIGSVVVLSAPLWRAGDARGLGVPWIAIGVTAVILMLIWSASLRRDLDPKFRENLDAADRSPRLYSRLDYVLVAASIGTYSLPICFDLHRSMQAIPIFAVLALWAFRYLKGYRLPDERRLNRVEKKNLNKDDRKKEKWRRRRWLRDNRSPIMAAHACFLLGIGHLEILGTWIVSGRNSTGVAGPRLDMWLAVMILSLVLIAARGHEKRLRGAYSTQNTWLRLHQAEVTAMYLGKADDRDSNSVQSVAEPRGDR